MTRAVAAVEALGGEACGIMQHDLALARAKTEARDARLELKLPPQASPAASAAPAPSASLAAPAVDARADAAPAVSARAPAAPAGRKGFDAGDRVTLAGLTERPDMNGKEGILFRIDEATGKWTVFLDDGTDFSVESHFLVKDAKDAPKATREARPQPAPTQTQTPAQGARPAATETWGAHIQTFSQGQHIKYLSATKNDWVDATVIDVREDGAVKLDVKQNKWFSPEQFDRLQPLPEEQHEAMSH